MGRFPWKKGKVFGVETRPNNWAIGQMLEDPHVAFYDVFSRKPEDENVDLRKRDILFVCAVTRQFISGSNTVRLALVPRRCIPVPTRWIAPYPGGCGIEEDEMVVFTGTKHERRIVMWAGARLVEERGRFREEELISPIDKEDEALIDSHELWNVRTYPELNERLYLCYKLGKNVDPLKDMILRRPIPPIYKRYVDIIES